jgi:hypothetical protein
MDHIFCFEIPCPGDDGRADGATSDLAGFSGNSRASGAMYSAVHPSPRNKPRICRIYYSIRFFFRNVTFYQDKLGGIYYDFHNPDPNNHFLGQAS